MCCQSVSGWFVFISMYVWITLKSCNVWVIYSSIFLIDKVWNYDIPDLFTLRHSILLKYSYVMAFGWYLQWGSAKGTNAFKCHCEAPKLGWARNLCPWTMGGVNFIYLFFFFLISMTLSTLRTKTNRRGVDIFSLRIWFSMCYTLNCSLKLIMIYNIMTFWATFIFDLQMCFCSVSCCNL